MARQSKVYNTQALVNRPTTSVSTVRAGGTGQKITDSGSIQLRYSNFYVYLR